MSASFINGIVHVPAGEVPLVSTKLVLRDHLGTIYARCGLNRNNYKINPGIYAAGNPDAGSDVFVTANYKLSFDTLRKNLTGLNCWILVLDTKGINVWCAAGKGTFGTAELINRINLTNLRMTVSHRKLIVPQLGAVGISAHEVQKKSGFKVIYGPVRAADIHDYIQAGYKVSEEMRRVKFGITDRVILTPVEISVSVHYFIFIAACLFLLAGFDKTGYLLDNAMSHGSRALALFCGAYLSGTFITPILLPYLPGRAFSVKGFITGLLFFLIFFFTGIAGTNIFELSAWFFIITSVSSFLAMNFTGASTFTSLSGVLKEMKYALPVQIILASAGLALWLLSRFLSIELTF